MFGKEQSLFIALPLHSEDLTRGEVMLCSHMATCSFVREHTHRVDTAPHVDANTLPNLILLECTDQKENLQDSRSEGQSGMKLHKGDRIDAERWQEEVI